MNDDRPTCDMCDSKLKLDIDKTNLWICPNEKCQRYKIREYHEKLTEKEEFIKSGIPQLEKCKNALHELKHYFYGDFKWNKDIKNVPNPNNHINNAIYNLEEAIDEAHIIEVNSL